MNNKYHQKCECKLIKVYILICNDVEINLGVMTLKQNFVQWRETNSCFYDFLFENFLDWPVTSLQWGPLLGECEQYLTQRLYFSCKTDGHYASDLWTNTPNYIVMADIELPRRDCYFMQELKELICFDAAKKHPNLKIKGVVAHPGEVTVVRVSPLNKSLLASKSDKNMVYVWMSEKYKGGVGGAPHQPDLSLLTTVSQRHNYAMRFAPSLPKLITASENRLQLFDIDSGPVKREMAVQWVKPLSLLEGHHGVEDITFKSNEVCISGGQDREIGVWDLRINCLVQKVKDIHRGDINAVACKQHYILSGGEDHILNIIDERNYKVVCSLEMDQAIYALQFDPLSDYLAVGKQKLEIHHLDNLLNHDTQALFYHLGLKGNINEFDWSTEAPMTLATTFQDADHEINAQGGIVHVFRPNDLFYLPKETAISKLKEAYASLNLREQNTIKSAL